MSSDELIFAEESEAEQSTAAEPWKVLIIDDESEVHKVTKLALRTFTFDERPLEFISAYSAREARSLLKTIPEIAVILLDVVMETENAGLELVHFIRRDLGNQTCRIILRTGQPGQAPEREVIRDYDINDYKAKTELTAQKLFTLMHTSLRSYRDIVTLERSRQGLERVILATKGVFEQRAYQSLVAGAMEQLRVLLELDGVKLVGHEVLALQYLGGDQLKLLASSGGQTLGVQTVRLDQLPDRMRGTIAQALNDERSLYQDDQLVLCCKNRGLYTLFFVDGVGVLSDVERRLLELFSENLQVALENIRLNNVLQESRRELVHRLGGVIESRSEETGFHVQRVALYSERLAELAGLPAEQCELIKQAAPLHDIGKVGIPDNILGKPGRLDPDEWEIMKTHAEIGQHILAGSGNQVLDAAAEIAISHHERWDGSGYPAGLAGEAIPIFGRITAVADVFDALGTDSCYRQAWPEARIAAYFAEQKGRHFDPELIRLFLDHHGEFVAIRQRYPDRPRQS